MKKFISGFITGAVLFSIIGAFAASYVAETAGFKVLVNGEEFQSDPPALVVEGRTYLPLRAMGDALGVPVEWNAELGQAEVGTIPDVQEKLFEIKNYITETVWNKGFCDISWYISNGTNSTGDVLDVDFAVEQLKNNYDKKYEYDEYISNLDDSYQNLKNIWEKLSAESDKLFVYVTTQDLTPTQENSSYSTELFQQYFDAFYDAIE